MDGSGWSALFESRAFQAFIAGAFLALGWIVNGWQDRRVKAGLRAEKLRDYHKALFAEIRTTLAALSEDDPADWQAIADRISDDFKPFVPRERHDRVYETLLPDIDVLPRQTIDEIVAYYAHVQALQAMAEDLREASRDKHVAPERVALMYRDYMHMRQMAFAFGEAALELIDAYSKGGAAAADARLKVLSTRAGGRDGRPSAEDKGA